MRYLSLVVLAHQLEAATRAIAQVGVLHLLDVRRAFEALPPIQPFDVAEQLGHIDAVARTLAGVMEFFGIQPPEPDASPPGDAVDLAAAAPRAGELSAEVQGLRQSLQEVSTRQAQLDALQRNVRSLAPLGLPLDQLRGLRYAHLASGLLPERNLQRLRESLSRIPHVIVPASPAAPDGRILISAFCLRQHSDTLDRALRSAQLQPVELPADCTGMPAEVVRQLDGQLAASRGRAAALEAQRVARGTELAEELRRLWLAVQRERLLVEARGQMGHSERIALIAGWVPAALAAALERTIRAATGGRCVLRWADPTTIESVRRGRLAVPILLRNAILIRPFEGLLRAYGLPRYGEVEPTAVVALAFLTMFGFMFGDIGQGLVLFALGYLIYRRMFRYRDYAVILMECGVFAAGFGVLYGSVFGSERLLPALWLHPMENVGTLVQTAIAFGIVFLSVGIVLNLVNAIRRRDPAMLWGRNGLLAALTYWTAVGLLIRHLTATPGSVSAGGIIVWLAVPIGLILLKEPVRAVVRGVRTREWPNVSDALAIAVESCVEVLDTVISAISNTATFIRLAAFALSHAGLFLATFSVADAIAAADGVAGTIGSVAVLVAGNVIIIALEGMIVAIQSVRLEYYEFFSKFYSGGGEPYRPLRLPAPRPAPG
jgi:V/A-type H+-transporting ATPase subunit I